MAAFYSPYKLVYHFKGFQVVYGLYHFNYAAA